MSSWLEYGIDTRKRTILLSGEIGDSLADRVISGLRMMPGTKPVTLLINSGGGDDDACRAIIGAIRMHSAPIHGLVVGVAESAAAWIFEVCKHRTMTSHSSLMFHLGDSPKNKHNKYVDKLFVDDVHARMLEKDPSYPRSKLVTHVESDWNVYPTQAVELGLADEFIK